MLEDIEISVCFEFSKKPFLVNTPPTTSNTLWKENSNTKNDKTTRKLIIAICAKLKFSTFYSSKKWTTNSAFSVCSVLAAEVSMSTCSCSRPNLRSWQWSSTSSSCIRWVFQNSGYKNLAIFNSKHQKCLNSNFIRVSFVFSGANQECTDLLTFHYQDFWNIFSMKLRYFPQTLCSLFNIQFFVATYLSTHS